MGRAYLGLLACLTISECELLFYSAVGKHCIFLGLFILEILASQSLYSALEESCLEIEKNDQISFMRNLEIHRMDDHPKYMSPIYIEMHTYQCVQYSTSTIYYSINLKDLHEKFDRIDNLI